MNVESKSFAIGRIPITKTWPSVDGGLFPAKAFSGEVIEFGAIAFREGHDAIAVDLLLTDPKGKTQRIKLNPGRPGLDQWLTKVQLSEIGTYSYQISAWDDEFETWLHNTEVKLKAGVDQELMMLEGQRLLANGSRIPKAKKGSRAFFGPSHEPVSESGF